MPTIEIASVGSEGLIVDQSDFAIAARVEDVMESHRGLFYDFLIQQQGAIIHLGNPDLKNEDAIFFASDLIDWKFEPVTIIIPKVDVNDPTDNWGANQTFRFKFLDRFKPEIDQLLNIALEGSPIKRVYFLTDYQFGPEKAQSEIIYTISDLWARHESEGLVFNTLYELYGR